MTDKQFNKTNYIIYLIMCFTGSYILSPIGRHAFGIPGMILGGVTAWLIATVLYRFAIGPDKS